MARKPKRTNQRIADTANKATPEIAKQIVATMVDVGGEFNDVMILLNLVASSVIASLALQISSNPAETGPVLADLHYRAVRDGVAKTIKSEQAIARKTNGGG